VSVDGYLPDGCTAADVDRAMAADDWPEDEPEPSRDDGERYTDWQIWIDRARIAAECERASNIDAWMAGFLAARLVEAEQQLDQARRRVDELLPAPAPAGDDEVPF